MPKKSRLRPYPRLWDGSNNERYRYPVKLQLKKSMAVTTAALAFVLPLTACGSDEEGASGGLSTAAEAPSASAANSSADASADESTDESTKTETETKSAEKDKKDDQSKAANEGEKKEAENQAQGGEEAPTLINPFENGLPENTNQPLENGEEGSRKDRKQMEEVARAVLNPGSLAEWTPTILDNSCAATRDAMLEELERQGVTMEQIEQASRMAEDQGMIDLPSADVSVDDVRIDGDRASASVTAKSEHGEDTNTLIFQKEDGRWKICN